MALSTEAEKYIEELGRTAYFYRHPKELPFPNELEGEAYRAGWERAHQDAVVRDIFKRVHLATTE